MKLATRPLTPDLWPAFEDLFGENGAVGGCWCMYWRIGGAYRKKPREENKSAFREIVERGPPPGLLAFHGDIAVGWCQLTPRDVLPWLDRAWRLKRVDDAPVWSLSCFYAQRLSQEGRYGSVDRSGTACRKARKGTRARSLSPRCGADTELVQHWLRLDLLPRRIQNGCTPRSASPDYALRSGAKLARKAVISCPKPLRQAPGRNGWIQKNQSLTSYARPCQGWARVWAHASLFSLATCSICGSIFSIA